MKQSDQAWPNGVPPLVTTWHNGSVVRDGDILDKNGNIVTLKQLQTSEPDNPLLFGLSSTLKPQDSTKTNRSSIHDGWQWFGTPSPEEFKSIAGKYLFFSQWRIRLANIASVEMERHKLKLAKISLVPNTSGEYVLCLYHNNDSLKHELAVSSYSQHGLQAFGIDYCQKRDMGEFQGPYLGKYRWWKSNKDTLSGIYSQEHLNLLPTKSITPQGNPQNFNQSNKTGTIYGVFGPNNQLFYIGFTTQSIQDRRTGHLSNCLNDQCVWSERAPSPFALMLRMLHNQKTIELLDFRQIGEGTKDDECRLIEEKRLLGHPILNIGVPCYELNKKKCSHGGGCYRVGVNWDETWSIGQSGWAVKPFNGIQIHLKWALFHNQPPSSGSLREDSSVNSPRGLFVFSECPVKPSDTVPKLYCWNHLLEKTHIDLDEYGKYDYAVDGEGQVGSTELITPNPEANCSRWWWRQGYTGHGHPIRLKQKEREGCFLLRITHTENLSSVIWAIPDTPSSLKVNAGTIVSKNGNNILVDDMNPPPYFLHLNPDYADFFVDHRLEERSFTVPNEHFSSFIEQIIFKRTKE